MYGVRNLMERFWSRTELEAISIFKAPKVLATGAAGIVAAEIIARLGPALAGQGTSLAPLVEPASASAAFSIRSTVTR